MTCSFSWIIDVAGHIGCHVPFGGINLLYLGRILEWPGDIGSVFPPLQKLDYYFMSYLTDSVLAQQPSAIQLITNVVTLLNNRPTQPPALPFSSYKAQFSVPTYIFYLLNL